MTWPTECIHGNPVLYECPQCQEIGLGGTPCTFKLGKSTCGYGPNHNIHQHIEEKIPYHKYQTDKDERYCENCGALLEFSVIDPLCADCRAVEIKSK